MLTYDPDETYWNCVCLLLPDRKATLVDTDIFEQYGHYDWRVMGDTICRSVRYTVVINPTARRRNWKTRMKYRFESLPRLVMMPPSNRHVDHISRCRWDNRANNLRVATPSQNSMNRPGSKKKASSYKGVYLRKDGKWNAKVTFEGNQYHLGTFTDETEAALAYNAFVKVHCPEFGYLNPIAGATADDEPTAVKPPPKKRISKLVKLTPREQKIKKLNAQIARSMRTAEKQRQKQAEMLATKKPWEPGDPTWPPVFVVRLREPRKAVNYWGETENR